MLWLKENKINSLQTWNIFVGRGWDDKGGQNAKEKDENTCSGYGICTWILQGGREQTA